MRLSFAVLPILLLAAGCTDDSGTPSGFTSTVDPEPTDAVPARIALEYSAKDPDAAQKAEKQCAVYGRTAKPRAATDGAKANVVAFDCL